MDADRSRLLDAYRATRCDLLVDGRWEPLDFLPEERAGVILTAWNPRGRRLPDGCNRCRDEVLRAELAARALVPLRARGRSRDASWSEESWLVPHHLPTTLLLLRRYDQLAGLVLGPLGRSLLWWDGACERLDTDRCPVPAVPQEDR